MKGDGREILWVEGDFEIFFGEKSEEFQHQKKLLPRRGLGRYDTNCNWPTNCPIIHYHGATEHPLQRVGLVVIAAALGFGTAELHLTVSLSEQFKALLSEFHSFRSHYTL